MSLSRKGFGFGNFVLDCDDQVLLSDGKPVPLTPKAYLLLKTLVENHGRVIEKQELIEAVWPDSFVEEGNLPYTANLLRKTLGDSKSEPRFIETVPRRGYRFIAPVTALSINGAGPQPDSLPEPSPAVGGKGRLRWPMMVGAVAIVMLLATGIWFATRKPGNPSAPILSRPFSVEQLSTSGNSAQAAISPDGTYAVYSEESGGKDSLWLRRLDGSENVQIVPPSADEYLGLTFSNSGTLIYFVRLPRGSDVHALPALYRIDAMGGVPVKLASNVNHRITVSPDDTRIAFSRCQYRKENFCNVVVADANGENDRTVVTTESGVHIRDMRFSPDGRSIAVAVGRSLTDNNDAHVFEVDLETGGRRDLFAERFAAIESVEWVPDGRGLLFVAADFPDGKASIFFADRKTGKLEQATRDAASYSTLSLDRAGSRMIAVQQVPDFRITTVTGGVITSLPVARDLVASPGGKIVYSTFDGEVWSINPDGSDRRQLTNTRSAEGHVRVSPDQRHIFFSTTESGNRHIWRMNADGSDRKQLTRSIGGYPLTVSADGRYVFCEGTLDSKLYKVGADGGEEEALWAQRLYNSAVAPNGMLVAHFFNDGMVRKIAISDLNTKERIKVIEAPPDSRVTRHAVWSADGRTLYFLAVAESDRNSLWRQSIDVTSPEKVADLKDGEIYSISAAEDGNYAYIVGGWRFDVMLLGGLN